MSLKSLLKKTGLTLGATLLALTLGCNSLSSKTCTEKPHLKPKNLEEKVSKSKRGITFSYKLESKGKGVDYSTSQAVFYQYSGTLSYYPNVLELSSAEQSRIEDIINDIKSKDVNSYQNFIEVAENLSEEQKLVLLGAIGCLLDQFSYDGSDTEVASQDEFFYSLQGSLESGNQNGLGVCRHIHSHIEQLANDLGMNAAAVTGVSGGGGGHVYTIIQTEDGSAIVDYNGILIANTRNIEETLEAYQKWRGTTVFRHLFFEDAKFKYKLITEDGKRFLDFIGYDESLRPLEDVLIRGIDNTGTIINIDQGNYLNSFEFNHKDFFIKVGDIKGSSFSPMNSMELLQTGYKGKFSILGAIDVNGNMSFVYGRLNQDKSLDDKRALGAASSFIASTNNEDAFNFGFKIAGGIFLMGPNNSPWYNITYDFSTGIGASYKFSTRGLGIKPYIAVQYSLFPKEIGSYELGMMFNELGVGTHFDIKTSDDTSLSIEPYYTKRLWEEGLGANVGFGNKNFKLNLGAYTTKSNYEFCPHKNGFNIGLYSALKNLGLGIDYKRESLDYSGDKENQDSLHFRVCTRF